MTINYTLTDYKIINGAVIPIKTEYPSVCEDAVLNLIKNTDNLNISQEGRHFVIDEAKKRRWNKILAYFGK